VVHLDETAFFVPISGLPSLRIRRESHLRRAPDHRLYGGVRIGVGRLQTRFYIDPATGLPHINEHQIEEDEVIEVLEKPIEDRAGRDGSRIALGQTASGRYLRVVYVPDPEPESVFVITAYEVKGKPLAGLRRRRRKKQQ
jgi:hypothetical protein